MIALRNTPAVVAVAALLGAGAGAAIIHFADPPASLKPLMRVAKEARDEAEAAQTAAEEAKTSASGAETQAEEAKSAAEEASHRAEEASEPHP